MDTHLTSGRPFLQAEAERRYPGGPTVEARFEIPEPGFSITVLFGPSGSGKTTALRLLAGLEPVDRGVIRVDGEMWSDAETRIHRPPQARRLGFLSQTYDLFPHLTVAANLGYGLTVPERPARAAELLPLLGLEGLGDRLPGELSGGQQQRVALGRALARKPRLLLLDEPLSALDRPSQQRLRKELRELLRTLDIPTILVTHDRTEALQLGDRLVVMDQGRVCQSGSIQQVFNRPTDPAVARILGVETVVLGRIESIADGMATLSVGTAQIHAADPGSLGWQVFVCIRGEDVAVERGCGPGPGSTVRNRLPSRITGLNPEGPLMRIGLDCGFPLEALVTRQACQDLGLREGDEVCAILKAAAVHLIPHD
ncbi:ATP-binding cassette domain-containing protein [Geothrix sp. SG200]|uniref:ABC transporter ATP-binding protein n=1 Tax=Geothrix sp. SG200 TaxID=2922865 RepID=UPI001FABFBCB